MYIWGGGGLQQSVVENFAIPPWPYARAPASIWSAKDPKVLAQYPEFAKTIYYMVFAKDGRWVSRVGGAGFGGESCLLDRFRRKCFVLVHQWIA